MPAPPIDPRRGSSVQRLQFPKGTYIRIFLTLILLSLLPLQASGDQGRPRRSARDDRIARAERREHVRMALHSAAAHGYYVFDELMTEDAGMIDFLAVGPVGACVVVVRDEPGEVTGDVDGALYLDARPFADDPIRQAAELADDVYARIAGTGAEALHVVCFTRAELFYVGDDRDVLQGVYPTWDLPLAFEEAEAEHTSADVDDLAELVRKAYGRPPFVVPEGREV